MRIKIEKQSSGDSGYIEFPELFAKIKSDLPELVSVEEVSEAIFKAVETFKPEYTTKLNKGVLNLSAPINIGSTNKIESEVGIEVGTMYYDLVNERVRLKVKSGWKTIE